MRYRLDQAREAMTNGDLALAERQLAWALEDNPADAIVLAQLAIIYLYQHRVDDALTVSGRALEVDPKCVEAQLARATALRMSGQAEEAMRFLRAALADRPESAEIQEALMMTLLATGEYEASLSLAERAMGEGRDSELLRRVRTETLSALGRSGEARVSAEEGVSRSPDDPVALLQAGILAMHEGDDARSKVHFTRVLALEPYNEIAREGLLEGLRRRRLYYRLLIRVTEWMEQMPRVRRWGLMAALMLTLRFVRGHGERLPQLQSGRAGLVTLYLALVYLTWVCRPLSDLLLRTDPAGRELLSDAQREASTFAGLCLALALVSTATFVWTGNNTALIAGIVSTGLVIPIGGLRLRRHRILESLGGLAALSGGGAAVAELSGFHGVALLTMTLFGFLLATFTLAVPMFPDHE